MYFQNKIYQKCCLPAAKKMKVEYKVVMAEKVAWSALSV